jgi:hypothetical protein
MGYIPKWYNGPKHRSAPFFRIFVDVRAETLVSQMQQPFEKCI